MFFRSWSNHELASLNKIIAETIYHNIPTSARNEQHFLWANRKEGGLGITKPKILNDMAFITSTITNSLNAPTKTVRKLQV